MTPIVLCTNPDRENYVDYFMDGVPQHFRDYVYVASTWNQELGAIQEGANYFDRFALIQDSMKIHNWSAFISKIDNAYTAYIIPRPSCYSAVYQAWAVNEAMMSVGMPGQDKEMAITGETMFVDRYFEVFQEKTGYEAPVLFPSMTDGDALAANRFFKYDFEEGQRLHLQDSMGILSKFKATYR